MKKTLLKKLFSTLTIFSISLIPALSTSHAFAQTWSWNAKIEKPADGSPIIVALPEVTLSELTVTGMKDPKPEWSENAKKYLIQSIKEELEKKKYKISNFEPDANSNPDTIQVLKLNKVVSASIFLNDQLPTKKGKFEWTLGEDVKLIVPSDIPENEKPKYALFFEVEGTYSSAGRKLMTAVALVGGVGATTGAGQAVRATLVDLKTGQIVWYNLDIVSFTKDIRTQEGSKSEIVELFQKLPL